MTLGVISEILLVAGILLDSIGVFVAINNRIFFGCGMGVFTCGYYTVFEWQVFYLALALMSASAVGFLFMLRQSRKASIPPK